MEFGAVRDLIDGVPHMRPPAGRKVYDFVIENRLERILELGTYHGVSTCYLAAAAQELEHGTVLSIDRRSALSLDPTALDLAERTGLGDVMEIIYAHRSFTWELKKMLEDPDTAPFDFVFLDAGHLWDTTGFAFFLVDRLLRPGGWMLFDDLEWSIEKSPSVSNAPWANAYSPEEREAQQVSAVFDLLVSTDPRYETHRDGNWGWARKRRPDELAAADAAPTSAADASGAARRAQQAARAAAGRARRGFRRLTDR